MKEAMVHTRHSRDPNDQEAFPDMNGHSTPTKDPSEVRLVKENSTVKRETRSKGDSSGKPDAEDENHDAGDTEENKGSKSERGGKKKKHCLQEAVVNLYDFASHDSDMRRRSLRNRSRQRDREIRYTYEDMGRRPRKTIKDSLGYKRSGRYLIRKSDRHSKKLFETFNVHEIQKTMERKHREMLELQEASMYDSIKRRRRDMSDEDTQGESEEEEEEEESEEEEDEEEQSPGYSLRKCRTKTNRYEAPPTFSSERSRKVMMSPIHHIKGMRRIPQHASPNHRRGFKRRRTSSTSSSDDEAAFERRKAKSMTQGRVRCLPMNFKEDDMVGILKHRERAHKGMPVGASLADVDPMAIDTKTTFNEIGGLEHHIRSLKEMVIFPLLYPEVFQKFNISPPRGVLFHGPPGTGKTLVARALSNECSSDGKKVAFFMRKGADCLSKWVGESERQLRLLFDQAYTMRPSIIFFDEIDGIAPVRSTRQDQIHSSIVSTLLALMDGLDARGEVIVIGATNRLDSIDPALRRPGRFDREFLFSLPNKKGREKIFEIHTASWQPKLSQDFIVELADKCVGYCGADIKALCTETALLALRRRYPQIYQSKKKLQLDTNEIRISSIDFKNAMKKIIPASRRANHSAGFALPEHMKPLLSNLVKQCRATLNIAFPAGKEIVDFSVLEEYEDDEEGRNIFERGRSRQRYISSRDSDSNSYLMSGKSKIDKKATNRPRLLVYGNMANGQSSYIGPALLYAMEHLSTHMLDLPSLYSNSAKSPEETIAQVFREARRNAPSIIYLPHVDVWWNAVGGSTHATLTTLLQDIPADMPILFLATAEDKLTNLSQEVQDLFELASNECVEVVAPSSSLRHAYFKDLLLDYTLRTPPKTKRKELRTAPAEVLEEAPEPKQRELSAKEMKALMQEEESVLRELRLFLREITWKLLADRKFKEFSKPVDLEEIDDYLEIIKEPMDLSTIMTRINSHSYFSCAHFLKDVDLITNNCLEYNPDKDQFDRLLRTRACELRDLAHSLVHDVLDPEFEKSCIEIYERRMSREKKAPVLLCDHVIKDINQNYCAFCEVMYDKKNEKVDWLECKACHQWFHERCFCKYLPGEEKNLDDSGLNPPSFLKVMPKATKINTSQLSNIPDVPNYLTQPKLQTSVPDPQGSRYSRRVRGLSESEKNKEDLDHVLSRKRTKPATEPNTCEEAVDVDPMNGSDQELITEDVGSPKKAEESSETEDPTPAVMPDEKPETTPVMDVSGVKRNLGFENISESCKEVTEMEEAECILTKLVENTYNNSVERLCRIYAMLSRIISRNESVDNRMDVLEELREYIDSLA